MRQSMIGLVAVAVLSAASLSACQKAEGTEPASAPAQAEATADAASAEAFVRSLYSGSLNAADPAARIEESDVWSARTKALIAETDRLTPEGMIGFFEADPICDCQDGTPVLQSVAPTVTGPTTADVIVVQGFSDVTPPVLHHKTYKLVWEDGGWRIDDMVYGDMGDEFTREPLVQQINAWIADAKAQPAEKSN